MLSLGLCDFRDAYIVVEGRITVEEDNDAETRNKKVIFKNNAPFRSCISKNNIFIENAEDLDIVMTVYNLLEYSDNYSMTSGSLWNFYKDDVNDNANENNAANNRINNNKTTTSKFFEYKTKIIGRKPADNNTLDTEVVVPLKYLSNFWRFLNLSLINCEIKLDLSLSKDCIVSEIALTHRIATDADANPPFQLRTAIQTTGATFQINNAILSAPVVTMSINDNIKFLEYIKQSFKRTISWKKYRSEITTRSKNNNLDYLIDPTFRNIDRLFAFSFRNGNEDPTRDSFDKY